MTDPNISYTCGFNIVFQHIPFNKFTISKGSLYFCGEDPKPPLQAADGSECPRLVFDPNDKSPANISIWENKDRVRIQYKSEGSEWTVTFYGTAIEKWDLEVPKSTNKDTSNAYICVANNCF